MSDDPTPDRRTGDEHEARPVSDAGAGRSAGSAVFWPEDYTPMRADHICMTLIAVSGVYGIGMMLARPYLLGANPLLLVTLTGSRSGLVTIGAQHAVGAMGIGTVVAAFVLSTLSVIKFDLLFWWAARLWGDFFLQNLIGESPRRKKQAARAEAVARRYESLAIVVCNIPVLPVPRGIVSAVLGISGTTFRKLFLVDLTAAAVVQAMWLYLGWRIGEPVVQVVEVIARYSLWISLGILVVLILGAVRKSRAGAGRAEA